MFIKCGKDWKKSVFFNNLIIIKGKALKDIKSLKKRKRNNNILNNARVQENTLYTNDHMIIGYQNIARRSIVLGGEVYALNTLNIKEEEIIKH